MQFFRHLSFILTLNCYPNYSLFGFNYRTILTGKELQSVSIADLRSNYWLLAALKWL